MKKDGLIKKDIILDYYFHNGIQLKNQEDLDKKTTCIYEVIRLIKGVPIFIEEHLKRMRKSAEILGYSIKKTDIEISEEIVKLSKTNNCTDMNVKLLCCNLDKEDQDFFTYFVMSNYPKAELYEQGIDTILYNLERTHPNVKVVNNDLRKGVNLSIAAENAFEGLLVDRNGFITEGSRSNVFFVKNNTVYTAPSEKVLVGVTRTKIMKVCEKNNICVEEKAIHEDMIQEMDGAFLSGTSINVLPIKRVGTQIFDSVGNIVIKKILDGYLEIIDNYIQKNRGIKISH